LKTDFTGSSKYGISVLKSHFPAENESRKHNTRRRRNT